METRLRDVYIAGSFGISAARTATDQGRESELRAAADTLGSLSVRV
jgi:hypothetical protein